MSECLKCKAVLSEEQEVLIKGRTRSEDFILCEDCASGIEQRFKEETQNPRFITAILLGLAAALAASFAWYGLVVLTDYQWAILAIAVSWLIAWSVMWGAGRKRGRWLQVISLLITFFTMFFSSYLITHHFYVQFLSQEGPVTVPYIMPFQDMLDLVIREMNADIYMVFFWFVAMVEAYSIPAPHRLRRATVKAKKT